MRFSAIAFAVLIAAIGFAPYSVHAAKPNLKTVAALNKDKATLAGQSISANGKVVKVNNGIMGRNFIHLQDGTGDASNNNLIVTSKQTAKVGDMVVISGMVAVNRDFGSGYAHPLLIENATITPNK